MAHQLSFKHLIRYDPGQSGVTVDVALKLFDRNVSFAAKVDTELRREVVPPARFQRATFRLGGGRSMQLSYGSTSN